MREKWNGEPGRPYFYEHPRFVYSAAILTGAVLLFNIWQRLAG
jgi:hypothetical protein